MKCPPYGKPLAERIKFNNPPFFVVVCVGLNSWARAKQWNAGSGDFVAMALPPDTVPDDLKWPVQGCRVIVEYHVGPSRETMLKLLQALWRDHADRIETLPLQTDYTRDLFAFHEAQKKIIPIQEIPRTVCRRLHSGHP